MSLKDWLDNGWLKIHKTSQKEISDLFDIVERDLKSARTKGLDLDWKFGIAYNAALKLCTNLLYAEGYRPERANAHYRTIDALPQILGSKYCSDAEYLNSCRATRNTIEYEHVGDVDEGEVKELIDFIEELRTKVIRFLSERHSVLKPMAKGQD